MKKICLFLLLGLCSLPTLAADASVQVSTITEGYGPSPAENDVVKVHYHGTLLDGTVFDSSLSKGPATFSLSSVIPCWTAGLQAMHVGETAQIVCPPAFAYGSRGVQGRIPPNSTLVFEVQLLEIMKRK